MITCAPILEGTLQDRHSDLTLIDACAAGDRAAQQRLMLRLMPVLQTQVAAVARRVTGSVGRTSRHSVQDLLQDVLVELLRNDAQELRRWDPARGLTLEGFARLVARRFALRRLLRGRPEPVDATEPDVLEVRYGGTSDDRVEHRDELDAVLGALDAEMTPRDRDLFRRLFLEEQSSAAVAEAMGMSAAALKKWRSRLYQRARGVAERIRQGPSLRAKIAHEKGVSPSDESGPTTGTKPPNRDVS